MISTSDSPTEKTPLRSGPAARVAVVGATGAAGTTVLQVLREREFPLQTLRLLASERSTGQVVQTHYGDVVVELADEAGVADADIVFFAAGSAVSRRLAPVVAAGGGVAVDKSSAYRMDPEVPLIVPEVNGDAVKGHRGILANPNCVAIPLTVALAPIRKAFGVAHVTLATYQAASGGGRNLVDELEAQTRAAAAGEPPQHRVYPHVLQGNVVPGGWSMYGDDTEEEVKIIEETRRVLDLPELPVSVTTVRVPVAVGHSAAVWIECEQPVTAGEIRAVLETAAGVRVVDDSSAQVYPTPRDAAGQDDILVGRIRADKGRPGAVAFFLAADNLRKGAATNAVQVAELALALR